MHIESLEGKCIATINKIRDTARKLETSLKYSRDLEAVRFLRYSILKSRDKILTDDLRKAKIRNEQMLSKQNFCLSLLALLCSVREKILVFRFISTKRYGCSTWFL